MHMRGWKRLLALTMALTTLLTTPALAERAAYVSDNAAPVYADASFGERIGTIARGSYLTVHAEQNGVADITYYGKDGYMPISALTYVQGEAEDAVVIRQTRFHQQPDRNSAYGLLAAGTAVRLMSVNGTCAMIEYDEHIGFVMRSDIRTASESASQPTAAPTAAPEQGSEVIRETFTATVTSQNAYVYQSRSTSAQRMRVAQGRVLTVVAYDDTWAQVFNGSFYAFIPRADIKRVETATAQPTAAPTAAPEQGGEVVRETFTATVTSQNAYVYQSRSTSAQRMRVAQGRVLTVVAYNNEWAQVFNGSFYAFIPRADIKRVETATAQPTAAPTVAPTAAPEQGGEVVRETFTATVTSQNAYVYQSRSTSAQRMRVAQGRVLTVVAYDDTWAQVFNGSFYAFIPRADIKRVETATAQPTAAPTVAPTAAPEQGGEVVRETFTATVTSQNAYVYQSRSTSAQRMRVAQGRVLTVVAYDDTWAQVFNGSFYAFIPRADIKRVETATAQPTAAPTATPAPTDDVVQESFTATVTAQGARVYQSPSTDAASSSLAYGSTVTVVAYDDTWAQVSNGSQLGFTQRSNLTPGIVAVATPTPTPAAGSFEELVESGKYSNEELTFLYLTREAGLNAAAACGVMANIKAESSFRPTAYNSNGGSYGICQWTGGRKTRLQNYCEDNGLDYTTIYGQLCFLEYELRNYYSKVWKYISAVDNTADGAYDAGYYFCYHFEVPANRASRSVTRGNSARDTYWPKYA